MNTGCNEGKSIPGQEEQAMVTYSDKMISIIRKKPCFENENNVFTEEAAASALRFHKTLPVYKETELVPGLPPAFPGFPGLPR